jgi:hypothetical protein
MISVNDLKTGDCILCHGTSTVNCLIQTCSSSQFSHAAVILRDPFYIDQQLQGIYILESTFSTSLDPTDKKIHLGVQLQPLEVLLNNYDYKDLTVRQLKVEILNINDKILQAYNDLKNKPYNFDPVDWLGAKIILSNGFQVENQPWFKKIFGPSQKQTESFWCSAMVAYFYVSLGVLDKDCSFAILAPEHFSQKRDNEMPWLIPALDVEKQLTK